MRSIAAAVAWGMLLAVAGCGGGGGGGEPPPPATYSLSGTVSGATVDAVTVTLSPSSGAARTTTTDATGKYSFTGLENGTYTLTLSKAGFTFSPASAVVNVNGANPPAQNFTSAAAAQLHAIRGVVTRAWGGGLAGVTVTLTGSASGSTITDSNGAYTFAGLADPGTYSIIPALAGYAFTPSAPAISLSGADRTQDFSADGAFAISGTVTTAWGTALPGVTIALSGGGVTKAPAVTDASGQYSFAVPNGTFTVTPTLPGYVHAPAAPSVIVNGGSQTQDFSADGAFTISGTVTTAWGTALAGVSVALSGGGVTKPAATTNGAGQYSFAVPNGAFTITPALAGYVHSPAAPSVVVNGGSQTQDFSADGAFTISGTVTTAWGTALAGVSVALSGGGVTKPAATTNGTGQYSFAVPNGTFTVVPALAGYVHSPAAPAVVVNAGNRIQNFSADGAFAIAGTVSGPGRAGVSISLSGGGVVKPAAVTDASGAYAFSGIPNGTFTLTPTRAGFSFSPASQAVVVSGGPQTQDFASSGIALGISGRVTSGGVGVAGATVRLGGASNAVQTTDASGNFTFSGLGAGQSYTVAPATFGYTFVPASRPFTVTADVTGADFAATLAGPGSFTFTGTLGYAGTKTGPVYVSVNGGAGGTGLLSQTAPWSGRAFTIRNVLGSFVNVTAWLDTLGTGRFNAASDPSVTFTASAASSPWDLGLHTLVDPAPQTVTRPVAVTDVVPANGAAAVIFEPPRNATDDEVADGFRIYWNTSATVDAGHTLGTLDVPAGPGFGIVRGLTNGTPYWFRVEARLNGAALAGQSAVTASSKTIGAPSGSATISGTVTHPAAGAPSALYVVAQRGEGPGAAYVQRIVNPAGTQTSYSIAAPPGTYGLFAFMDLGDDGFVLAGEPGLFGTQGNRVVTAVAGSNAGPTIAIPTGKSTPSVTTHVSNGFTALALGAASNLGQILNVRVSGPGIVGPVDIGPGNFGGGGSVSLMAFRDTAPILPVVSDPYTLAVTYTDGTADTFVAPVTGLFGGPPGIVAPANLATGVSTTPTFQWTAPPAPPGAYAYDFRISPAVGGQDIWQMTVPEGQTQLAYDADGSALAAQLSGGTEYGWDLRATDAFGNTASAFASFTTAAAALATYDTLAGPTLDGQLWQTPQFERAISAGRAVLSVAADHMQARTVQGLSYTNSINVAPGASRVTTLEADVNVPAASALRSGTALLIGGIRLNYQPAADRLPSFPGANRNILSAWLEVFDNGSGPVIRRRLFHCDDAACVNVSKTGITVTDSAGFTESGVSATAPAAYDTTYKFTISFNESTSQFTWNVQGGAFGVPGASGTGDPTAWLATPGLGMAMSSTTTGFLNAQLLVRAQDEVGGSSGAVTAEFDNVRVGRDGGAATLWDDFETRGSTVATGFNPALWGAVDAGAVLSAGRLQLHSDLTLAAGAGNTQQNVVNVMYPAAFNAWQVDAEITSSSPAGATGSANSFGMVGSFYNAGGGGPNNAIGDVRANVSLSASGASWSVFRCTTQSCGASTVIASGSLPPSVTNPFGVGTIHTVFQAWDPIAHRFTFQLDDAVPVQVDPTLGVNGAAVVRATPFVPVKLLLSRVLIAGGAAGASASVDVAVSNVLYAP